MKLRAHFGPSIPLVTFHSIKAQSEPSLTPTLCALFYQETGATYGPCHCLHRYIIKDSRTALTESSSGACHFLLSLSFSPVPLLPVRKRIHASLPISMKILRLMRVSSLPIQNNSKEQLQTLTNTHITPRKQHPSPKSITNNNALY